MKKRIISLMVALCLTLGVCGTVFAGGDQSPGMPVVIRPFVPLTLPLDCETE